MEDLAEIRSLAVHPDHLKKTIGSKLVEASLVDAKAFHIKAAVTNFMNIIFKAIFYGRYMHGNLALDAFIGHK